MKTRTASRLTCSALALACAGSAAFADVSSQEVWDKFRSYYESSGYEVTAQENPGQGGISLTGLALKMTDHTPEGQVMSMVISADDVTFADTDDGKVAVTWSDPISFEMYVFESPGKGAFDDGGAPAGDTGSDMEGTAAEPSESSDKYGKSVNPSEPAVPVDMTDKTGAPADDVAADKLGDSPADVGDELVHMRYTITHDAPKLVVSGEVGDLFVTHQAAALKLALSHLDIAGEDDTQMKATFDMTNFSVDTHMRDGDLWTANQVFSVETIDYMFDMVVPDEDATVRFSGQTSDLKGNFDSTLPQDYNPTTLPEELSATLRAGMSVSGQISVGAGWSDVSLDAEGTVTKSNFTSESGSVNLTFNAEKASYATTATGVRGAIKSSDLPFPINASFEELTFGLALPVIASDTPKDIRLRVGLKGVQMDDLLWTILDPTKSLPHDPATISFDLAGKANWLVDILDPEMAGALEGDEPPAELHALELRGLEVSAAGASLTGTGGFTFDNSDLETFDGLPAPDGKIDLKLEGGNTLLTTLIKMGVVSEEDALPLRMMLGVFAKSDPETDTLTTTFEVKPDGSVSANGMPLQ